MIKFLTSDFKNYEKVNGEKITHPMSNENGIVDQLKQYLKDTKKVVFVASDISNTPENVKGYADIFFNSMKMVGITFDEYYILDGSKCDQVAEYINGANLVFLCGGDTYKQHEFFEAIDLKSVLSTYDEIVMGQSAGALNMAEDVFNSPEEMEESEPVFYKGLGLTNINIEPHFVYDDSSFDEATKYQREAILKESYNRKIYGQVNGSHILIDEDNNFSIYGETYLIENGSIEKICENQEVYIDKLQIVRKR